MVLNLLVKQLVFLFSVEFVSLRINCVLIMNYEQELSFSNIVLQWQLKALKYMYYRNKCWFCVCVHQQLINSDIYTKVSYEYTKGSEKTHYHEPYIWKYLT